MQTKTQAGAPRGRRWNRWLSYSLIALPALGVQALAEAAPGAAAKASYRVIQLSGNLYATASINARGQVAFETLADNMRANFYDGHTSRDLGTLGGPNATVSALNDLGEVVGSSDIDAGGQTFHAYRWRQSTGMVDLTRNVPWQSSAIDINNKGQVLGAANSSEFAGGGVLWSAHGYQLPIPIMPSAINDAGTIAGFGGDSPQAVHALVWTRLGGVRDLGAEPGEDTRAVNINRAGHIVGTSGRQAFLWTPRHGLAGLGSGGAGGSVGIKANDQDVVVGFNRYGQNCVALHYCRGFIWTRATGFLEVISAGSPASYTSANDVNKYGQVVGSVDDHAYIWSRGQGFVDLNALVAGAPAGLKLIDGLAISDNGAIVATANNGLVLLVPKCGCAKQAPVVGPVRMEAVPQTNMALSFSATFTDADVRDTHKATWTWGDGSTDHGTLSEKNGAGNVSGQHAYRSPGIYTARLTVTDSGGQGTTVQRQMVVHGPGAHIAGQGRFMSPPGASMLAPKRGGVASFAILSGAGNSIAGEQGASIEFRAAGIHLRSAYIDSLTMRDGRLQYTGTGSVNGKGGYHFMATAIPANGSAGGKDRIRMRIWHDAPGSKAAAVDYDNWPDSAHTLGTAAGAAVTGGAAVAGGVADPGGGSVVDEGAISIQP